MELDCWRALRNLSRKIRVTRGGGGGGVKVRKGEEEGEEGGDVNLRSSRFLSANPIILR